MILEREQWHLGYASLLRDCRGSPDDDDDGEFGNSHNYSLAPTASVGRALILTHPTTDALATARILAYMLRCDGVPHQLRVCLGWERLKRVLRGVGVLDTSSADDDEEGNDGGVVVQDNDGTGTSDVRAVVLINMGATRNLSRLFSTGGFSGGKDKEGELHLIECFLGVRLRSAVRCCTRFASVQH